MHVNTSHKAAVLVKLGHILRRKCPLVFPLMSYDFSVCLQPFILAELSPTTTRCCSCSFGLQAAYMLLSGTSVNHRVEAEQSQDIISIKYDPVLLKLLFYATYEHASLSFVFRSSGSWSKLHKVSKCSLNISKKNNSKVRRHITLMKQFKSSHYLVLTGYLAVCKMLLFKSNMLLLMFSVIAGQKLKIHSHHWRVNCKPVPTYMDKFIIIQPLPKNKSIHYVWELSHEQQSHPLTA